MKDLTGLETFLEYNPDNGLFKWINNKGKHNKDWFAGTQKKNALHIQHKKSKYLAHRIAFYLMTGSCPALIDHINQNPFDNRFVNLRPASRSLNALNSSKRKGVDFHKHTGKWRARIRYRNLRTELGQYATEQEAVEVYLKAKEELINNILKETA
jgi:hypothetical protein